ncbi:STAS domain-containing protein [Prauserella cavernicola]|uniref:Anti-sigma factor antagonist n=1 Tax=Prauserella cavernicola TaxID=2800127 RepID=A0A934V3Y6_9PSEU|nr:STAS domain-containing protein [Prauserella cavernicola]MBK1783550.1 STAS domain-containing protein [Prauserella cavernicola]
MSIPGPSAREPNGTHAAVVSVRTERRGDVLVLAVAGEIDMATAPRLDDAIAGATRARPRVLVVDLSEVVFLSAAGMSALMRAADDTTAYAGSFRVVASTPLTQRVLELMGLDDELEVHRDLEAACREPNS